MTRAARIAPAPPRWANWRWRGHASWEHVDSSTEMDQTGRMSESQQALLALLRKKTGESISRDEVLAATGWKPATLKAYLSKGHLSGFLREQPDGSLKVIAPSELDEWTFTRALTQSGPAREVGGPCGSALARALMRKARDNMVLALELYNRPSLENRLDAFCMLFCTAWEQLLKAEVIEETGEEKIYTEIDPGRRPKTISLERCLETRFSANDPVRANIAEIAELRHGATHLLMPELQGVLSRLFQAGVLNFAKRFPSLGGVPLFPPSASGLLSLIGSTDPLDVVSLRAAYGARTAGDIVELVEGLNARIDKTADERYAIAVEYRLVLTKSESKADIALSTATIGEQRGVLIEKPVAVEKKYPHSSMDVVAALKRRLPAQSLNPHDVQAMVFKEKWKSASNEYHYFIPRHRLHFYSDKAVADLADKITRDPSYLARARESYRHYLRTKSRSSP